MRKIAVVTGTRAEYGLLYWIIKGIHEDPELDLQLIVTGTHLSPEYGLTVEEIEMDGLPIAERIEMLLSSDTETAIATSMGLGMIGFARAFENLMPDIVLVLGDRYEILSAVAAAVPFRIPVAHIHGGETTEGAMDESFRHAITKMSHLHFPSTPQYAQRIIQMGENPKNVFCFGAPGLDSIFKFRLIEKKTLGKNLSLPVDKEWGIVTFHPETLEKKKAQIQIKELLQAVEKFQEIYWIFTLPNADTESRIILESIDSYVREKRENSRLFKSLGQLNYLSLLKSAVVMVGNSSSGIIEAPSFGLPVVNIGDRQKGRIRTKNVIDVPLCKEKLIGQAIREALSNRFKESLRELKNPYGNGQTSETIVNTLRKINPQDLIKKKFFIKNTT